MHVSAMEIRPKRHWKPLLTGAFAVRGLLECFARFAFRAFV